MLLLEELFVDGEFETLLGPPEKLPKSAYPQAIAVAIALRHSWRPDDLRHVADALGSCPVKWWKSNRVCS